MMTSNGVIMTKTAQLSPKVNMINSVDLILPGLFIGDKNGASDVDLLSRLGITHILSVELVPPPQLITSTFPNMVLSHIQMTDMPSTYILSHLESGVDFISSGLSRENGRVLVHCYHGISRSSSFVIAYIMKTHKMSFTDALNLVRTNRGVAEPNHGFRDQLLLWEEMNYKLDYSFNIPFKMYRLCVLRDQMMASKILSAKCLTSLSDIKKKNNR